jgi:hypothetical protein
MAGTLRSCSRCGRVMERAASFCPYCGARAGAERPRPGLARILLALLYTLVTFILCGLAALYAGLVALAAACPTPSSHPGDVEKLQGTAALVGVPVLLLIWVFGMIALLRAR